MLRSVQNNTVLLAGWLFADLLLGLMVIFLAAIPGVPPPPPAAPPRLIVTPSTITPLNKDCAVGNVDTPRCLGKLTLKENDDAKLPVTWSIQSDISNSIKYSYVIGKTKYTQTNGTLHPGESVTINLSTVPCQNGSFTFTGTANASPVSALWKCQAIPDRLETNYIELRFTNEDTDGILNNDHNAISRLMHDIESRPELRNRRVGLVIVQAGATTDNTGRGTQVAQKVYTILSQLTSDHFMAFKDASQYHPIFDTAEDTNTILIDIYRFKIT